MSGGLRRQASCLTLVLTAAIGCADDREDESPIGRRGAPEAVSTIVLVAADGTNLDDAVETIGERIAALGIADATVETIGNRVTATLPINVEEASALADGLASAGEFALRPVLDVQPYLSAAALERAGSGPVEDGCMLIGGMTPGPEIASAATVVLAGGDDERTDDDDTEPEVCYLVGPVPTDGDLVLENGTFEDPEAQIVVGEWAIVVSVTDAYLELFNDAVGECYERSAACPTGQLAITLDDVVISAPTIQQPEFNRSGVQISGNFTEGEARALAVALQFAGLPQLTVESVTAD